MMDPRLKVLSSFAVFCLLTTMGCGGSNSDGSKNTRSYRLSYNGCDSGQHVFRGNSPEDATNQMCKALQDQTLNNNCDPTIRQQFFAKNCPGRTFVLTTTEPSVDALPAPAADAVPVTTEPAVVPQTPPADSLTQAPAQPPPTNAVHFEKVRAQISQITALADLLKYLKSQYALSRTFFDETAVRELTPVLETRIPIILASKDSTLQEAFLNFSESILSRFTEFNFKLDTGLLGSPVESLRVEAAGNILQATPTHELAKKIVRQGTKSQDAPVRSNAYYFLGKSVEYDAIDRTLFINGLGDGDPDVRNTITNVLDSLYLNNSDFVLIKPFLKHKNDEVRNEAAYLIGRMENDTADVALIEHLNDQSPDVRNTITNRLDSSNLTSRTIEPLVVILKTGDETARNEAAYLLGRMDHLDALKALIDKLDDKDPDVRNTITNALDSKTLPQETLKHLAKKMDNTPEETRNEAAYLVGRISGADADNLLILHLSDSSPDVRNTITNVLDSKPLGNFNFDALVTALNSTNPDGRSEAAYLLGRFKTLSAEQALKKRKSVEKNPEVISSIENALER